MSDSFEVYTFSDRFVSKHRKRLEGQEMGGLLWGNWIHTDTHSCNYYLSNYYRSRRKHMPSLCILRQVCIFIFFQMENLGSSPGRRAVETARLASTNSKRHLATNWVLSARIPHSIVAFLHIYMFLNLVNVFQAHTLWEYFPSKRRHRQTYF